MRRSAAGFVAAAYLVYASRLTPCRPCLCASHGLRSSSGEKGDMRRWATVIVAAAYLVYASRLPPCPPCLCAPHGLRSSAGEKNYMRFGGRPTWCTPHFSHLACLVCKRLPASGLRLEKRATGAYGTGGIKRPAVWSSVPPRRCGFCRMISPRRACGRPPESGCRAGRNPPGSWPDRC